MWKPEDNDTTDDAAPEMREIRLRNGDSTYVDAMAHPMLTEWDWEFDSETAQIVRLEDGKKHPLYEEHLRWYFRCRSGPTAPVLSRQGVRALFGHLPAYKSMLLLSQQQRECLMAESGSNLPLPTDLLATGLSLALLQYYEWLGAEKRWAFTPDDEKLTPGTLLVGPGRRTSYHTVGRFLQGEFTGVWVRSRLAATGQAPETYAMRLQRDLFRIWRETTRFENFDQVEPSEIETLLREAKRPVFMVVRYACDLIHHYKIPI